MRKKAALTMDVRYVTMIENAFFFVNPPEGGALKVKERPPIHSFIRKILYQDLSKPTTDKVLTKTNTIGSESERIIQAKEKIIISVSFLGYIFRSSD